MLQLASSPRRHIRRGMQAAAEGEGVSYTVTFGRIGTAGRSQTKELDDEEDAREAVGKLIAEKLAKRATLRSAASPPSPAMTGPGPRPGRSCPTASRSGRPAGASPH